MKLINTKDPQFKPSVVMLVYGEGGVGKTTFGSTAPNPILADCENGAKYFGLRGIELDVAQIETWNDAIDFWKVVKESKYETVVIDPIGELMEKLKKHMIASGDSKLVQKDGSPTMAGWGHLKTTLRNYVKAFRDSGKHVIVIAHIEEKQDDTRIVKRPKVETKLSDELVTIVDVVGYMTTINDGDESKRIIIVDPGNDKYTAKDRTGQLGKVIPPDFGEIVSAIHGTKEFKWAKSQKKAAPAATKKVAKKSTPKEVAQKKLAEAKAK